MLDPALITYLQKCKNASMPFSTVAVELTRIGWTPEHIKEAEKWYSETGSNGQEQALSSSKDVLSIANQQLNSPASADTLSVSLYPEGSKPRKVPVGKILGIAFVLMLFLLSGTGVLAYMIAADKIPLENELIKKKINSVFLASPIFPKTPKFVLAKAFLAHEKVSQNSLDFSLAAQSNDFQTMLGTGSFDVQLKGYTDISDTKNPKFDLTGYLTKDLNIDIKKNDKIIYIKVNKIPAMLAPILGVEQASLDKITEHWIAYDSSPLDTEAQRQLQEINPPKSATDEVLQGLTTNLLNKDLLSAITLTNDSVDSIKAYKLEFKPNDSQVDVLEEILSKEVPKNQTSSVLGASTTKLSDVLSELVITLWVDQKDYYVRKTVMSFTLDPKKAYQTNPDSFEALPSNQPSPSMSFGYQSPITVVAALQLSDFGKTLPIETPTESVTPEEFYKILTDEFGTLNPASGGYSAGRQYSQARDTQRRSDLYEITSAVYQYAAEHEGRWPDTDNKTTKSNFPLTPTCIGTGPACFNLAFAGDGGLTIVPSYLDSMPKDPLNGTDEKTGYQIWEDAQGRVVASASGEVVGPIVITR